MAKKNAKAAHPVLPPWVRRVVRFGRGPGRPAVAVLGVTLILGGLWFGLWRMVRDRVLGSDQYVVTAESLDVTPPPRWVPTDIRDEVCRDLLMDGPLSVLAPDAVKRVSDAFALHPWVARVYKVTKHHPARIRVALEYRRPVCMVEVTGGLYPVDARGVRLPVAGFDPYEASTRYPRLSGVDTMPLGPEGTCWGDERVVGAAEIAAAFGPAWRELRLYRIVPEGRVVSGHRPEYTYLLLTQGRTPIRWGRAPSTRARDEIPAKEKIARLVRLATEHGSLDGLGPLDVSRPESPPVAAR
ncbi:MAG: hypothetical protein JW809_09180 [Pirellulales bacterium]|nr:hypothetical protein [Pirellulales bacterium]